MKSDTVKTEKSEMVKNEKTEPFVKLLRLGNFLHASLSSKIERYTTSITLFRRTQIKNIKNYYIPY